MDKIVIECPDTGICIIDVDRVVKKWNHLFWIAQYGEQYRLIKYKQKNSPATTIKVVISEEQFNELRDKLELVKTLDTIYKRAASWRPINCL